MATAEAASSTGGGSSGEGWEAMGQWEVRVRLGCVGKGLFLV